MQGTSGEEEEFVSCISDTDADSDIGKGKGKGKGKFLDCSDFYK